jgi:DNA primase
MRAFARTRGLDRSRLPHPIEYYARHFAQLKGRGMWMQARCCFHEDDTPSLSLNTETGRYHCFGCDARGDLISFQMRRHGQDFKSACKALGAWR